MTHFSGIFPQRARTMIPRTSLSCRQADDASRYPGELDRLRSCRVFIETYGCRYNFGDTAKLVEVLKGQDCTIVSSPEEADAVIVNTCTVVGPTERRMLRRLSALRDHDLYVAGCMPAVQREAIFSVCTPSVISPQTIYEHYRRIGTVSKASIGIVQLAQGCSGSCTYCLTRFARGPIQSFPASEISSQVQSCAWAGAAEIQLTAQDASAWGTDCGSTLPALLAAVDTVPGRHRVRVGMMNPATVLPILDELVEAFAGEHLFRFLHLPVQSGSDTVLRRMGRRYTVAEFEEIIAAFRKRFPGITLATDMIVGFPGETEEDFAASLAFLRRVRPNKVNVTRYSRRPLTPVAGEKDFPDSVKKDRSRMMERCAAEIYAMVNANLIGTEVPYLVTEAVREGSVMARSPEYTGIVINEDLPVGSGGSAILKKDRKYFFIGERVG
jgi:MiaB/RimO family radical SAM methylthiotransferase